jgi:DNA repair protein RadA/Sms
VGEVDRAFGGGLVDGSATLVYGEPGVGKSTLLLQVLMSWAVGQGAALLVSAEESAAQVRARAARLGPVPAGLLVVATSDLDRIEEAVEATAAGLVVVDSVQTVVDAGTPGPPGTLTQVRSAADRLTRLARSVGVPVVLVGHVTKEGGLAGPRALEHLVDTVAAVEGDRHHTLRVLRVVKHRFGSTGEVGLFEMSADGLAGVDEPGNLLLSDRRPDVPGSAVTALLEGRRPLLVEIQALVCHGPGGGGRRTVQGVDGRRLASVLAVLECRAGVSTGPGELFVSAAGGMRAVDPSADLPAALAVASGAVGVALPSDLVSFGEIGLAGEIRQVPGAERRLAEAARLGFNRAVVPAGTPGGPPAMVIDRVRTLAEAVGAVVGPSGVGGRARRRFTGGGTGGGIGPTPAAGPAHPALPPGTMATWSSTPAIR